MEYEVLKKKLRTDHKMSLKDFTDFLEMHRTTSTSWKNNKVPIHIIKVIEGMDAIKKLATCEGAIEELERCRDKIKRMCEEAQK